MRDEKLHPQGDGVFGHGGGSAVLGFAQVEQLPSWGRASNAQCPVPQAAGQLSLSTHKGMEFPAAFDELAVETIEN